MAAASVEGLEKALEDLEITHRLFTEADGKLPEPDIIRLSFVGMLPHEVSTYVSLHLDMQEYKSLGKLNKFVLKYAKPLMSRKSRRPVYLVEHESRDAPSHPSVEPGGGETHEGDKTQSSSSRSPRC